MSINNFFNNYACEISVDRESKYLDDYNAPSGWNQVYNELKLALTGPKRADPLNPIDFTNGIASSFVVRNLRYMGTAYFEQTGVSGITPRIERGYVGLYKTPLGVNGIPEASKYPCSDQDVYPDLVLKNLVYEHPEWMICETANARTNDRNYINISSGYPRKRRSKPFSFDIKYSDEIILKPNQCICVCYLFFLATQISACVVDIQGTFTCQVAAT